MYTGRDGRLRPCAARYAMYTAVYTARTLPCTRRVHGPSCICRCTAVYTGPDGPCRRPCNGRVRVTAEYTGRYTAMYALCRRPKTAVHGRVYGRSCTRYMPCTQPKTAVHTAHPQSCTRAGPYAAVYTGRYGPYPAVHTTRYTAESGRVHAHGPCTCTHVHGRIRAVYTTGTGPCIGRVHVSCTRPCTRHVHGRRLTCTRTVHSRVAADTCTGRVHGRVNGTYTAVYIIIIIIIIRHL